MLLSMEDFSNMIVFYLLKFLLKTVGIVDSYASYIFVKFLLIFSVTKSSTPDFQSSSVKYWLTSVIVLFSTPPEGQIFG